MKSTCHLFKLALFVVFAITGGCATQPTLTQEQILNQNRNIASLNTALKQARSNDAQLLAAESYTRASNALIRAMEAAKNNVPEVADEEARQGQKAVDKLNRDISITREILAEVLQARNSAYKAGADKLKDGKIDDADIDLKRTATMIEDGHLEKAKKRRPQLIAEYHNIELLALKQNTMSLAKSALAQARKQRADRYAPKTLAQAEEEMRLAVSILDADRTQTDKANSYAKKAKWLAERSAAITETVKDFDRRDFTMEDIVLWHQQHLKSISEPLGKQPPFNEASEKAVISLRNDVARIVNEKNLTRAQLEETEEQSQAQLKSAEKRIAGLKSASQAAQQKERAERQKFEAVQAMFDESEANVFRQRKNVLISIHGFQFPSGQSEIQANNFPLMNKIVRAINIFPKAYIEVTGHTDSLGDDTSNQLLSEVRAEKVGLFLNEVGGVQMSRIMSHGYGESRPVATNETRQGRAKNRRIEIKIINE